MSVLSSRSCVKPYPRLMSSRQTRSEAQGQNQVGASDPSRARWMVLTLLS